MTVKEDAPKPVSTPKVSEEEVASVVKTIVTKPLASGKRPSRFSISETLNHQEEEVSNEIVTSNSDDLPKTEFTQYQIDETWYRFLRKIEDSLTLKTIQLTKGEEHSIEVHYPSDYSKSDFQKIEYDFITLLKEKTNNYSIQVTYIKDQKLVVKKETKREKFNRFVEINPLLKELDDLMRFDFI